MGNEISIRENEKPRNNVWWARKFIKMTSWWARWHFKSPASLLLLKRLFRHRRKKYQSSASPAFARGIHRWPANYPHKWPVTQKMPPFEDVIMCNETHPWTLEWCEHDTKRRALQTMMMTTNACKFIVAMMMVGMLFSLLIGPWGIEMEFHICNFQSDFSDWWRRHLLWNCPQKMS